jgi:hypothetical protein
VSIDNGFGREGKLKMAEVMGAKKKRRRISGECIMAEILVV